MTILQGLDAVSWQHLDTFFGSPEEMPDLLRAVAQQLQGQPIAVGSGPFLADDSHGDEIGYVSAAPLYAPVGSTSRTSQRCLGWRSMTDWARTAAM
jgi:hypothetical protein